MLKIKQINKNFVIYLIYLIGLIIGVISSKNETFIISEQSFSIKHLINVFLITFFMFFVLFASKNNFIFYILLILCITFRGFSLGVLINALLLNNYIFCIIITLMEIIIIINLFIFVANNNIKETYKVISLITIIVLFYSIILELVGDKFG